MADEITPDTPATPAPAAPEAPATPAPVASTPTPAAEPAPAAPAAPPVDPAKGYWPDDWRTNMAGGDEKALKQLERYQSPADIYKKARELERRMSSGELKRGLDANATPEEVAAWRKENGIPDSADGYTLPQGIELPDEDKAKLSPFLERMHAKNASPEIVQEAIAAYAQAEQEAAVARAQADADALNTTKDELISEWGLADYRKNVAMINGTFMGQFDEETRSLLASARLADGTPLMSNAGVLRGLTSVVREINPAATVVPNSSNPMGDIDAQIADYKKMMTDTRGEYYTGPKADFHQAQYRKLLEAKEKIGRRVA